MLKPPDDDYNGDNDENTVQLVEGGPQAPQTIMTQAHRGPAPVLDYPTNGAEMNVSSVCCQQNTQGLAESNFWILKELVTIV